MGSDVTVIIPRAQLFVDDVEFVMATITSMSTVGWFEVEVLDSVDSLVSKMYDHVHVKIVLEDRKYMMNAFITSINVPVALGDADMPCKLTFKLNGPVTVMEDDSSILRREVRRVRKEAGLTV